MCFWGLSSIPGNHWLDYSVKCNKNPAGEQAQVEQNGVQMVQGFQKGLVIDLEIRQQLTVEFQITFFKPLSRFSGSRDSSSQRDFGGSSDPVTRHVILSPSLMKSISKITPEELGHRTRFRSSLAVSSFHPTTFQRQPSNFEKATLWLTILSQLRSNLRL